MNKIDLTPALKRPLDPTEMGRDVASLNNLVGMLNDPRITGAEVPPGTDLRAKRPAAITDPNLVPDPAVQASPAQPVVKATAPAAIRDICKVFYTGRIGVGKDHVAAQTGAVIFGIADPIYEIINFFTGLKITSTSGKGTPGVRACMQVIGQWGRGMVSDEYPITPARITFTRMIQSLGDQIDPGNKLAIDWQRYGRDENLWLASLVSRVNAFSAENSSTRVAVTNVRFENEYKFLTAAGWKHYHVMCSPGTWARRLAKQGLTDTASVVKDKSEQMAGAIDADVMKKLSKQPVGPVLRAIWNDPEAKCPSSRLLTVGQFLQECAIQETTPIANTGE